MLGLISNARNKYSTRSCMTKNEHENIKANETFFFFPPMRVYDAFLQSALSTKIFTKCTENFCTPKGPESSNFDDYRT